MSLGVGCLCVSVFAYSAAGKIPSAYHHAAAQNGVPAALLYAIALTESGREYRQTIRPWPWALNIDGEGQYFRTQQRALKVSARAIQNKQSVDVGLMQINWYWHRHRFPNLIAAWEPVVNLDRGAQILREQYDIVRDWWQAVGRYHAPTNLNHARAYRERVRRHWEQLR